MSQFSLMFLPVCTSRSLPATSRNTDTSNNLSRVTATTDAASVGKGRDESVVRKTSCCIYYIPVIVIWQCSVVLEKSKMEGPPGKASVATY